MTNKGDLISRSELKKAICKKGIKGYERYNQGLATALDLIDLAPTVEPETKLVANVTFNKEEVEELVEKAKADILAQIERPQGKWISNNPGSLINYGRHCSICNYIVEFSENFCPSCGANMRGENK